jgi:hypothetical protein
VTGASVVDAGGLVVPPDDEAVPDEDAVPDDDDVVPEEPPDDDPPDEDELLLLSVLSDEQANRMPPMVVTEARTKKRMVYLPEEEEDDTSRVQALEILLSWGVTTALLFLVVLTDEKRMSEERLENAWPIASRNLFLVWLGILALPFHFARTRGRFFTLDPLRHLGWWKGFVMGITAAVVVGLIDAAIMTAFAYAAGLPIDD